MKRAFIYARVSDPDQIRGTSLESQVKLCTGAALAEGYLVRDEDILTEQFTASVMDRPVINKARAIAAAGEHGAIFNLGPRPSVP